MRDAPYLEGLEKARKFEAGLHQISCNCYAFLQPGGGFCLSNSGLLVDGDSSLLVDTLIDIPRTKGMLDQMVAATPAAKEIDVLINTHAHPDHTAGNAAVPCNCLVMTNACANEYRPIEKMVNGLDRMHGDALKMMHEMGVENFSSEGVKYVAPNETFDGFLSMKVGGQRVEFHEMGPSHAMSDTLVYVKGEGVAFTGDMMFADCHLVLNHPQIDNWVRACNLLLSWDVETIVPGHGRVCDKVEVQRHLDYLLFIEDEARRRFDKGMSVMEASLDLFDHLGRFAYLYRADLLYKNVASLYARFKGEPLPGTFEEHMAERWRFRERIRGLAPGIFFDHVPDGN